MKLNTAIFSIFGSFTIGLVGFINNPVKAAIITYDVTVDNLSGSLSENTFFGSFSFDDVEITGSSSEFADVFALSFDFLGETYTENDDNSILGASAEFFNGEFLGLRYSTDVEFSFVPGFFSLNDSFFAYDFGSGDNGTGDISYVVQDDDSTPVPEPMTVLGTLTTLGFGVIFKNKKVKITK